jgi:hypothetical protein
MVPSANGGKEEEDGTEDNNNTTKSSVTTLETLTDSTKRKTLTEFHSQLLAPKKPGQQSQVLPLPGTKSDPTLASSFSLPNATKYNTLPNGKVRIIEIYWRSLKDNC